MQQNSMRKLWVSMCTL